MKHRLHPYQLEEEIGRQQGRNTLNNTKNNIATPEARDSTVRRHERSNTDVIEENETKNNFIKMIEALKEE